MSKKSRGENLKVYLNAELVGTLIKRSTGAQEFTYDENWMEKEDAIPISQSLPLIEATYRGEEVYSFFENLGTEVQVPVSHDYPNWMVKEDRGW